MSVVEGALVAEIKRLFLVEKVSMQAIFERVKISLITAIRVCRTLELGRYGFDEREIGVPLVLHESHSDGM